MNPAIEIRKLEKRYGALQALAGVDLEVAQGEFLGLLGPNGAGKTTLISIVAGLTRATSGEVRVLGADVVSDYRRARRLLGVVPQELVFDPFFSVRETLRFQAGYFGLRGNDAWIDEVMHNLDLTSKADANMRALSGGMKRRVLVAQALVHKPPVIVLDEPTAGVDVELRQGLWRFIRGLNRREQYGITSAMLNSGTIMDFSDIDAPKADKHSTGGVGDKTSLIIAPLAAACGSLVRGLTAP